ncbi:MAG: DEAD/DEAH box helicase [Kiritimatiellae bacterium]|nr:DEAD/DEAH box helicase [Kiritimatiellia bacterium]
MLDSVPQQDSGSVLPPVSNWRTTDQDEINRRRARAAKEAMQFRNLTPEFPVFSNFSVTSSASGQTYQVELRSLKPLACSCTCVDFRVNGLGTCKHVEGVLRWLRTDPFLVRETEASGSPRVDLVPDMTAGRLMVERNLNTLPSGVQAFFDTTGLALPEFSKDAILAAFTKSGRSALRVSQEVAPWVERQARGEERIRLRRAYEQQVRSGHYPAHETKVPLLPYQREGMLHLAFTERALLADEMGLGKTAQAIAAAALLLRLGQVKRVLVVAPASLKTEWEEQIRLFTDLPYRLVFGDRQTRKATYGHAAFFTLANYEQILRDVSLVNTVLKPDCVILDEAQRIKNWDTQTAQAVKQLKSRYVFVLTGTPLENRIDELFSLMSIVDPEVLGPLFRFNRDFYVLNANGRPEGYQNLQHLRERLKPYLLRRRKAEVENELPDRVDRTVHVPMTPEQRERYEVHAARVARLVAHAREHALSGQESERLQRELSMMRMICDTPFILDPECRACPKLVEIQNLLESALSAPGVKVLLFSEWERMLMLVREVCLQMGVEFAWHTGAVPQQKRRLEILRFKSEPECRVFLSTDTGGVGLNLQQASVVINCDLPWSPARLEQRVARAWRKNQVRSVTVVNLVTEDSVEARMVGTLAKKRLLAEGVLDGGGEGLERQTCGTGRSAFLQRLEAVVPCGSPALSPVPHPSFEALRAVDPELGFAAAVSARLGERMVSCEMRKTEAGAQAVLLVLEGDLRSAAACAEQIGADWFGKHPRVPLIEVVTQATYDAMNRLVGQGFLSVPQCAVRTLFLRGRGLDQPQLLPGSAQAREAELRLQAAQAYRKARRLVSRLAFDASRQPLEESVVLLARAYAVQRHLAEPQNVRQALSDAYIGLWGDIRAVLQELLECEGSQVAVARVLMTKFGSQSF